MSTLKNENGDFMPHFESRKTTGVIAAINAEVVHAVNGDESAVIYFTSTGTLNMTYSVQGSFDGTNFFDIAAYPLPQACAAGIIPQAATPLVSETVNAASIIRALCVATGGLSRIRIRASAYASGTANVTIISDTCSSINPYIRDQKSGTLIVTATSAVGAAVTAALPVAAGLRHYIDNITVVRSATAALTPSATPVLVTTTNIPGTPAFTFGSDAGGIGVDKTVQLDPGGSGMAATSINTTTTVLCPAYAGVIWRVTVTYRLGL